MIQEQIRKGYLEEVEYEQGMFVSQGFVQAKPGRYFPDTSIPMCRLLVDCRALNSACIDSPWHHYGCCPDQVDMCARVPLGAKFFRYYDLSDAFHTCSIAPESANLVVAQFNGKFYRYLGGAQGIANMAVHWNIHLMGAFDRVLGLHWRDWYTCVVDDLGCFGNTVQQARVRGRILETILTVLEKPFSDKTEGEYSTSLDLAGLHFTEHGVRLSDEAFDTLQQCLKEYPVKTAKDIQHVVGVIQYSNSAFVWPGGKASAEYSDLLTTLSDVSKLPAKSIPARWQQVYPPVRDRLLSLMQQQPWAYLDPRTIVDDDHSFEQFRRASAPAATTSLDAYHQVHLTLSADDVAEMRRAYLADDTLVHGVPIADIFRVVTQHPTAKQVPKLHVDRIVPWVNKRFFKVPTPHGDLMYAPSSAMYVKYTEGDDKDMTRHLVTVLPKGAQVQITSVPPVANNDRLTKDQAYLQHDLRRDVLVHCHDNADHVGLDATSTNVRALVWFPKMRRYIQYHYDSCAYCTAKRKAAPPDSNAVTAARRLKLVEFDHKIIPPEVAEATGAAAILTIVDVVSRVTVFVPVPDMTAATTARALYTRWYSLFGTPTVFRCDNFPSFTSAVMKRFHAILGVRHVDFSAPDNATHHAVVERRNKVMEKFIDVGVSKGDLLNAEDLELYCASAAASCNLEHIYNGHTVLEYLTGEVPRTHRDLVTPTALEAAAGDMDDLFLAKLRSVLQASNTMLQHARDDRARENALTRASAASPRHFTQFDLVPGDQVSYDSKTYVLLDTQESVPGVPAKAVIRCTEHDTVEEITVKYTEIRPLTDPRASRTFHSVS